MAFNLSKTLSTAAATGLVLGAITACGGSKPPPETPAPVGTSVDSAAPPTPADSATPAGATSDSAAAAPEAKACCKAKNECKGKGGCKTSDNGCAGKNSCRGKGGCNANCPK